MHKIERETTLRGSIGWRADCELATFIALHERLH
jgi:hypothetical protein